MICPTCKGGKTLLKKEQGKGCYEVVIGICDRCHGTGEIEMTNEEYIRSCSTEQMAEELHEHFMWGVSVNAENGFSQEFMDKTKKHIVEWLKEIHDESV